MRTEVVVNNTGDTVTVVRETARASHGTIQRRTITTRTVHEPAKPARERKPPMSADERLRADVDAIVAYNRAQEAQRHGPSDTRTYRERLKDRFLNVDGSKTRAENERAAEQQAHRAFVKYSKSLVGKTWRVGELTATIVADDFHTLTYQYAPMGKKYSICRERAMQQYGKSLTVVDVSAVTSGRVYNSKAPSGKQRITEV